MFINRLKFINERINFMYTLYFGVGGKIEGSMNRENLHESSKLSEVYGYLNFKRDPVLCLNIYDIYSLEEE